MSYALSGVLQAAVYTALSVDPALAALVGGDIYDAPPVSPGATYVTLGEDIAKDRSSATHAGATLDFTVEVHSELAGFADAKAAASAICDVLIDANLTLSRGALVNLRFLKSRARRGAAPQQRLIVLVFRAILDDGNL